MASDMSQAVPISIDHSATAIDNLAVARSPSPAINGGTSHDNSNVATELTNKESFGDNGAVQSLETAGVANTTGATLKQPHPDPAEPTPIEQVSEGIQPISDFVPKDSANLSHPTPPPDEPLVTGAMDADAQADVQMTEDATDQQVATSEGIEPPSAPPPTEQGLVRPRDEDDEAEEPAAKRSKVETASDTVVEMSDDAPAPPSMQTELSPTAAPVAGDEPVQQAKTEPGEDAEMRTAADSLAHTHIVPLQEPPAARSPASQPAQPQTETDVKQPAAAPDSVKSPADGPIADPVTSQITQTDGAPSQTGPAAPSGGAKYDTAPMTDLQKSILLEKTKNLKKTKSSTVFLRPVDPVALNIPQYFEIIKQPMDLSTMETKLKNDEYASIQAYADDFNLIISNCRRFNGDAHPITQQGFSMEAYFKRVMEHVPSADAVPPPKPEKKRSPSIQKDRARRESRTVAAPPPPPVSRSETFALQPDGTPQIRRQSANTDRPKRDIKAPQSREIIYPKKRKESHTELKFCEHVLSEVKSPKYGRYNTPFLQPVDPVAQNIPHYRQIVKHPMDISTMQGKLKTGQYSTASEFKKDWDLMIKNCKTFNPHGNPIHDMAIQLDRAFDALWKEKTSWERKHAPVISNGASSVSADESDEEDADEEEDEELMDKNATILALTKQLEDMQKSLKAIGPSMGAKAVKDKKSKKPAKNLKKSSSFVAPPAKGSKTGGGIKAAPAKKPKKRKQVSYDEKQEISNAVQEMDQKQVDKLTRIITENCEKYRNMEEMELEIDDLPNDVQLLLLDYVRSIFGNPKKKAAARVSSPEDVAAMDDDDFEPERGPKSAGKRKRQKPMSKKEQQERIELMQSKLAQFSNVAVGSGSESPAVPENKHAQADDTSGDDESEESEEE